MPLHVGSKIGFPQNGFYSYLDMTDKEYSKLTLILGYVFRIGRTAIKKHKFLPINLTVIKMDEIKKLCDFIPVIAASHL